MQTFAQKFWHFTEEVFFELATQMEEGNYPKDCFGMSWSWSKVLRLALFLFTKWQLLSPPNGQGGHEYAKAERMEDSSL